MRAIIQRVGSASVTIDGETVGSIGAGYMILLGVSQQDTDEQAQKLWSKISKLRIFCDEAGKTNLSIHDIAGSVLIVSQFTLFMRRSSSSRARIWGLTAWPAAVSGPRCRSRWSMMDPSQSCSIPIPCKQAKSNAFRRTMDRIRFRRQRHHGG